MNKRLLVILALLGSVTLLFGADAPRGSMFDTPSKPKPVKQGAFTVCASDAPTQLVPHPPATPKPGSEKKPVRSSAAAQRSASLSPKRPSKAKVDNGEKPLRRAHTVESPQRPRSSSAAARRSVSYNPRRLTENKSDGREEPLRRAHTVESPQRPRSSSAAARRSVSYNPRRRAETNVDDGEIKTTKPYTLDSPQRPSKKRVPLSRESLVPAPKPAWQTIEKKDDGTTTTITRLTSASARQRPASASASARRSTSQMLPILRRQSATAVSLEEIPRPQENPKLKYLPPKRIVGEDSITELLRGLYRTDTIMNLYTQLLIAYKTINGHPDYSSKTELESIQLSAATNKYTFPHWEKGKTLTIDEETLMLQQLYAEVSVKASKIIAGVQAAHLVPASRSATPSPRTILKRPSSGSSSGASTPSLEGRKTPTFSPEPPDIQTFTIDYKELNRMHEKHARSHSTGCIREKSWYTKLSAQQKLELEEEDRKIREQELRKTSSRHSASF